MIQEALQHVQLFPERTAQIGDFMFAVTGDALTLVPWTPGARAGEALVLADGITLFDGDLQTTVFKRTQSLRALEPMAVRAAAFTALHLLQWRQNNLFCGRCGARMVREETHLTCTTCHATRFPRISPAVIVGLIHQGRLLVTHYADRPYKGLALVAGYCEVGETLEATVCREVQEEVGLQCHDLRYVASQPWGLSGSLLMGFFATVDHPQVTLADGELADATWCLPSELPQVAPEGAMSLTATMIQMFVKHGGVL